eukprot:Em0020g752a
MSFASLRRVLRSARKGLCSTCAKTRYPQLEAAGAGHVGCLIYTLETLGQLIADEHRVTAMHVAARKGQIEVLIYLVENDMVKEIPRAKNGATPAHDAAGTAHLDCLRYLMKQTNINVNDMDGSGQTILHWAVLSGSLETVHYLIVEGQASIDSADRNGLTVFHVAAVKNYLPILKLLAGCAYKRYPKPQRLLNAKNKSGLTPLCCAAQAGHVEIVRWLATKGGGDPTIPTGQGAAPLHVATIAGQLEVVKYLYQFGSATAFGGLRSSDGTSALHFAAASGFIDIMKWLLEQKHCTGDEVDQYHRTPLHYAAESGHLKAIQILCEHGVNVFAADDKGNIAVELANDSKCVKYLETAMKKKPSASAGIQGRSKAKLIDNVAGDQSLPLPAFIDEDVPFEESSEEWETLQDLMNQSEIQQLNTASPGNPPSMQKAESKKRELEEKIRKEEEERRKKREELSRQEEEAAKKIRQQMIEEGLEEEGERGPKQRPVRKNGKVTADLELYGSDGDKALQLNRSSNQETKLPLKNKEKDTKDAVSDKGGAKGLFSKFRSKKNETRPTSPPPPSLPKTSQQTTQAQERTTTELALDGDPGDLQNIKPRAARQRRGGVKPVGGKEEEEPPKASRGSAENLDPSEEVVSEPPVPLPSSSPPHGRRGLQRRPTPHPHHLEAKAPGPKGLLSPTQSSVSKALNFDSTPLSSPSSESVNSVSPFNSPSPAPSLSPIMSPSSSSQNVVSSGTEFPIPVTPTSSVQKRTTPPPPTVPPPSAPSQTQPPSNSRPPAAKPPSLPNGFKHGASDSALYVHPKPSLGRQNSVPETRPLPGSPTRDHSSSPPRADSPTMDDIEHQLQDVLKILANNLSSYEKGRQPHSPKGEEEEKEEEEEEEGDDESGSDTPSSSEEEEDGEEGGSSPDEEEKNGHQSHHRRGLTPPITVNRPVMARNAGMSRSSNVRTAGLNNVRKQTRYPRLLKKKVVNLETIEEIQDELIHEAHSEEDQAYVFYRIHSERRIVQAWRRYIISSRITQRKATALSQKRQRGQQLKVFTAWRQALKMPDTEEQTPVMQPVISPPSTTVPQPVTSRSKATAPQAVVRTQSVTTPGTLVHSQSAASLQPAALASRGATEVSKGQQADVKVKHSVSMGAISSTNLNKAKSSSVQSMPQQLPKEAYIQWINQQLETQHKTWQDVLASLEGGTGIIEALANASGENAPRYNPHPKLPVHRQDNWRVAFEFMKSIGINAKGIEPADLASGSEAAISNMFSNILKWQDSSSNNYSVL